MKAMKYDYMRADDQRQTSLLISSRALNYSNQTQKSFVFKIIKRPRMMMKRFSVKSKKYIQKYQ